MKLTQKVGVPLVAGGIALAGPFGSGLGTASAGPGQQCGPPNTAGCQQQGPNNNPQQQAPNNNWQNRGMDQARQDRLPFNYNGQQVHPLRAGNGDGWGFWFLGQWIRL